MEVYQFGWTDHAVVAGTLIFSMLIGVYYGFCAKQQTNEDLLLGGKSMGIMPIAASMLVTYLSAIAVLGYPAEVYGYGVQIFMNTVTFVLVVPLSIYFFMTVFYDMQLTSVYEYLEHRFNSRVIRWFASLIFIIQMSVFMGVCLFAPSIAMSSFIGLKTWQSVVGLGLCATLYTSMGGLKAVVWTDVFQLVMILLGMFAIIIKGFMSAGGIGQAFETAGKHGRLELFNFTVDPFMRHNALNFILGTGFSIFTSFGTHQPQVQRYCSLPSLKHAIKATVFSIPLNAFTISLCLISGIVIFSTYAGCDPYTLGKIQRVDGIVPYFVKTELGFIPGMMGLFTSCVFSASLSTLSSGLNSLAAVTWEDFLSQMEVMRRMSPKGQANLIRFIAILYGLLSIALAFAAQGMGSILSATLTAMGALSGPLGAVFAMGILMPFVNKSGALSGMVVGFSTMIWITINAFIVNKSHIPLPFSADECLDEMVRPNIILNATSSAINEELQWPEKLYTLSYIMYPFAGGLITFIVSILVSMFTGGFAAAKDVDPKYLHPIVRPKNGKRVGKFRADKEMTNFTSASSGVNYCPIPTSGYDNVSKETQTAGYYYYSHDTESVTPPPPYVNVNTVNNNDYSQHQKPLLYRLSSSSSFDRK